MSLRKKFFIAILIFITLLLSIVTAGFFYEKYSDTKQKKSTYIFSKKEMALLQDGDIILRKGYGLVSESITNFLHEKYNLSHSGIICVDSAGIISVIHSLSSAYSETDGVQRCSLKRFCKESQSNTLMVVRFRNNKDIPLSEISKRAAFYCYAKIPFDNSFNLNTEENFYCTELLWHIFLDIYQLDLYPDRNNRLQLGLAPFYNEQNFQVIINHQKGLIK